MTIPILPSSLHCIMRSNFNYAVGDNRRMTSADDGPPRSRRQRSLSADTVQLGIETDLNGRQIFHKFYKETTLSGSIPFHMPDPILNNTYMRTDAGELLLTADGTPIQISAWWLCMFDQTPPQYALSNPGGVYWKINFSVKVMP